MRQVPVEDHLHLSRLGAALDRRTRAVVASQVHWQTGHRIDLAKLGQLCRSVGALSIVDAIQGLGQVPVDVTAAGIDVLVAGSYKWLMGIPGTAVLCASAARLDTRSLPTGRAGPA